MSVVVNGETVPDDLIVGEARSLRVQLLKAMPNEPASAIDQRAREWSRDNVIDQVLLRQAVAEDPELVTRIVAKLAPPKSKEITEYYKKNRNEFYGPEMVHGVHVLAQVDDTSTEEDALARLREVQSKLEAGADFLKLEGLEDLGYFPRGRMVPEFDAVEFALQPGQYSSIFRTQFGFHIACVVSRRPDGIPELNSIRADIGALLIRQKQRRAVDRYIDQLRLKADIRVQED